MAKKKSKEQAKSSILERGKKKLDISVQAVIDNMTFSKREVWAYYRISPQMYEFISDAVKASNAARSTTAFTALIENRRDPLELHFITTSTPVDIEAWQTQVESLVSDWDGNGPAFSAFIEQMSDHLRSQSYTNRIPYIGIKLGNRGALNFSKLNPLEAGWKAAWSTLGEWLDSFTKTFNSDISASEEAEFRSKMERYSSILRNGALQGTPVTAQELLLLIKRMLYPAMPAPYLDVDPGNRWGAGDLELEVASVVKNKFRWLEINQLIHGRDLTGYRAVLSLTKFPRNSVYPQTALPFLYLPQLLMGLPFTSYARVKLLPNEKMRKEIEKKRNEQADQVKNMQAAGRKSSDAAVADNSRVQSDLQDLRDLDSATSSDKTPWVEGSYRVVVETATEKAMRDVVAALKQQYSNSDITTVLSAGDQLDLFLEQMPGDRTRVNSFRQLTNLNHLATSGLNISSKVGDKIWEQNDREAK